MSSLLAILLVVNSTRGHHFLFSYPPDPQRPSSNRHANDYAKDFMVGSSMATRIFQNDTEESRRSSNASKSNNSSNENNNYTVNDNTKKDIYAGRDTIFNIDVSFLADALAPKSPLCDRKFQLSMDDLTFIGHPVSLSSPQQEHQQQQQQQSMDNEDHDIDHMTSPLSPKPPSQLNSPTIQPTPPTPSQQPLTSPSSYNNKLSLPNGDANENAPNDDDDENDDESVSDIFPSSTSIHMTLFHVVFVMTPPDLELNAQVETIYRNVILRYSSALRYEQLRCGYVQEEIEKVLGLKEEAFNKGMPFC